MQSLKSLCLTIVCLIWLFYILSGGAVTNTGVDTAENLNRKEIRKLEEKKMLAVNKNNKYSSLFCLLGIVCFLFTAGLAHANTYNSPYGSNQTHSVITTPGSHNFHIEGIFPDDRWTKWYVNGVYTGTDEDDHSFTPWTDAEYTYIFSLDGTIEIKGLVYKVVWFEWIFQEYHTWNVTVDTISPTRPGTPYMDSGSDSGKSNSDAITNIDKPTFRWNASSDSGTGVAGYYVSYTNPVPEPGPGNYWTVPNSWTPNLSDPAIPEGTRRLYVRAKDYAENYSSVSSFQFTIDKTAPSPPVLLSPANNSDTSDTTPTLDWSDVSGVWKYHVYVSDHDFWFRDTDTTASTWDVTPALKYKDWWWQVNATDIAGNKGSYSGQWKFTVVGSEAVWLERQKLLASDGAANDYFGLSVSISGDLAIVGAYFDDDNGSMSGSVYIFKWDGTAWSQQQKLLAADGAAGDYFGRPVSISGDYAIVGACGDDDKGGDSGSAYIFKWDGTAWSQQQKLLASDGAVGDYFGRSVSISGDLAIVGAHCDDDKGDNSGSAYIFRRDGTGWVQQQKLLASDGAASNYFGWSVSISGDYAIVGAYGDDDKGDDSGSAYIFEKCPIADLSGDCCVNFADFAVIGNQWLQAPGVPSADIAPEGGDGVVNFLDLDVLVNEWLQGSE